MNITYSPPLSVVFVWHPANASVVRPIAEYCYSLLSRDVNKPFSRSMNLPVFFRTTTRKGVPSNIEKQSDKIVIFVFVSEAVVADKDWGSYIGRLPKGKGVFIIPIAMDRMAFSLSKTFDNKNFIRAYEFTHSLLYEYMFISIAHEIYRYVLNDSFDELSVGKDNALKLFISHAKDGKQGIKLAKALKNFIDNTAMRNFFDATDIAIGYKFDQEIIDNISDSTLVAIHSDSYSSRYWCQREILSAKEQNRPIIAVDTLEEFEDRRFPFASNIPGIHVHIDDKPTDIDLLRILSATLLETVRYFYADLQLKQYKNAGCIEPDVTICPRPPEVADIGKIFTCKDESIVCKHLSIPSLHYMRKNYFF